ncbi:hypothetical protein ACHQM5_019678 [Ranunculus cassubicifolius]
MVKVKSKQVAGASTKKGKVSNVGNEDDQHEEEDDWVIVKKQKVTIIIPPPELPIQTIRRALRTRKVLRNPRKKLHPRKRSPVISKYTSPSPTKQVTSQTFKEPPIDVNHTNEDTTLQKPLVVPIVPRPMCHQRPTLFFRPIGCLNVGALQNRVMRASNLERKLVKAGGLNRWLMSLGLGSYVKMFHKRNVDKFQLLSMTMEKLKGIGVDAVGPRRKLIHAIDCLCQPNCFSTC